MVEIRHHASVAGIAFDRIPLLAGLGPFAREHGYAFQRSQSSEWLDVP